MNYQRITISIPNHVYDDLLTYIGKGNISGFAADVMSDRLLKNKMRPKDPVEAFLAHRKNLPKFTHEEIMAAIRKGRM